MAMQVLNRFPKLATAVTARVCSNYTIRFRSNAYDVSHIHGLTPGNSLQITHYQWTPKEFLQVTFIDSYDLEHHYILSRTRQVAA